MKNIVIIGAGYVGLVTAVGLAAKGNRVFCIDVDANKVAQLQQGEPTIYEQELEPLLVSNLKAGRLSFSTTITDDISQQAELYFIAVGTPEAGDGSAELRYVFQAAKDIASHLQSASLVVIKSTVPVGTGRKVQTIIADILRQKQKSIKIEVASNPEFLREGFAINDFLHPDRVIIGSESDEAKKTLQSLYAPFVESDEKILLMGLADAELSKYASNAFLATKISFINEMALLCDALGANVMNVAHSMGLDSRISPLFLNAGPGYGGSCFPKDVHALIQIARQKQVEPLMLMATHERNVRQKQYAADKIQAYFNFQLKDKIIGVWGLAFKPGTDDIRESSAIDFIGSMLAVGVGIKVYDPIAMGSIQKLGLHYLTHDHFQLANSAIDAAKEVDALVLMTEWPVFLTENFVEVKKVMRGNLILDTRNQLDKEKLTQLGFIYQGVGRR